MSEWHSPAHTDVLVVGAGPSGLTTALLLAARGLDVLVVESKTGTSDEPKAISLDDESLRAFQQAGMADDVMSIVVPGTGTQYYDRTGEAVFTARAEIPFRLGYPFKNPFAQPDLERVLASSLAALPTASIQFGYRLSALEQDEDGVMAIVRNAAGAEQVVHASFLVGADGGRSTVRNLCGIDMRGTSFDTPWLVVDTLADSHSERFGMHHGDPDRPHVIVPGLDGRCRYEFLLKPGEGAGGESPSIDLIQRVLLPYRTITPDEVERAVIYTFNALVAERWAWDRIFLVGDAAHMMPPFAGQGLNSGVRDAANLSWKLAEVVAGRAPLELLSTYEIERRPHAEATVRLSAKLGRIVMTTSARLAKFRDDRVRAALLTEEGRNYFEFMRYRPKVHLAAGAVWGGSAPELSGIPLAQPRVFDGKRRQVAQLDDVLGRGWSIIGVDVPPAAWAGAQDITDRCMATRVHAELQDTFPRDVSGATVIIDLDGGLTSELAPYSGRFILVRPDRLVAATWTPAEAPQALVAVSEWTAAPSASRKSPPVNAHIYERINE